MLAFLSFLSFHQRQSPSCAGSLSSIGSDERFLRHRCYLFLTVSFCLPVLCPYSSSTFSSNLHLASPFLRKPSFIRSVLLRSPFHSFSFLLVPSRSQELRRGRGRLDMGLIQKPGQEKRSVHYAIASPKTVIAWWCNCTLNSGCVSLKASPSMLM